MSSRNSSSRCRELPKGRRKEKKQLPPPLTSSSIRGRDSHVVNDDEIHENTRNHMKRTLFDPNADVKAEIDRVRSEVASTNFGNVCNTYQRGGRGSGYRKSIDTKGQVNTNAKKGGHIAKDDSHYGGVREPPPQPPQPSSSSLTSQPSQNECDGRSEHARRRINQQRQKKTKKQLHKQSGKLFDPVSGSFTTVNVQSENTINRGSNGSDVPSDVCITSTTHVPSFFGGVDASIECEAALAEAELLESSLRFSQLLKDLQCPSWVRNDTSPFSQVDLMLEQSARLQRAYIHAIGMDVSAAASLPQRFSERLWRVTYDPVQLLRRLIALAASNPPEQPPSISEHRGSSTASILEQTLIVPKHFGRTLRSCYRSHLNVSFRLWAKLHRLISVKSSKGRTECGGTMLWGHHGHLPAIFQLLPSWRRSVCEYLYDDTDESEVESNELIIVDRRPGTITESAWGCSCSSCLQEHKEGAMAGDFLAADDPNLDIVLRESSHDDQPSSSPRVLAAALLELHRCFLRMGDLMRYQALLSRSFPSDDVDDYNDEESDDDIEYTVSNHLAMAQRLYIVSSLLAPRNGQPYNQLAVSALLQRRCLDAIFYYARALSVKGAVLTARDALLNVFHDIQKREKKAADLAVLPSEVVSVSDDAKKEQKEAASGVSWCWIPLNILLSTEKNETDTISPPSIPPLISLSVRASAIELSLLHHVGVLFTGIDVEELPQRRAATLRSFDELLKYRNDSPRLCSESLVKLAIVTIFSVRNAIGLGKVNRDGITSFKTASALSLLFGMSASLLRACANDVRSLSWLLPAAKTFVFWLAAEPNSWKEALVVAARDPSRAELIQRANEFSVALCNTVRVHAGLFSDSSKSATIVYDDDDDIDASKRNYVWNNIDDISSICEHWQLKSAGSFQLADALWEDTAMRGLRYLFDIHTSSINWTQRPLCQRCVTGRAAASLRLAQISAIAATVISPVLIKCSFSMSMETSLISAIATQLTASTHETATAFQPVHIDLPVIVPSPVLERSEISTTNNATARSRNTAIDMTVSSSDESIEALRLRRLTLQKALQEKQTISDFRIAGVASLADTSVLIMIAPVFVVLDTNCFCNHLDLVERILNAGHVTVCIPSVVLRELNGLADDPRDDANIKRRADVCKRAFVLLETELKAARVTTSSGRRRARLALVTGSGEWVQSFSFYRNELYNGRDESSSTHNTNDDRILDCCEALTRRPEHTTAVGEAQLRVGSQSKGDRICCVLLITNDRNLRVKGYARRIPVADTQSFLRWDNVDDN